MKKETSFDVIVIGAGAAGLNIAGFMNHAGFRVLLVEREEARIGGDCLNFGCIPSKALIHIARMVREGSTLPRFGLSVGGRIDIKKVMEYVHKKQEKIRTHENVEYLRTKGMTVVIGHARFVSRTEICVGDSVYKGKKIVIATGSVPRTLLIPGIEKIPTYTNETIFSLETLPKNLTVIGGGPVGVELGQAFSYLGSKVTILGHDFLSKEHPEVRAVMQKHLKNEGIDFFIGDEVKEIINEGVVIVHDGEEKVVHTDAILLSVGRVVSLDTLDVLNADIALDKKGALILDQYLRTTNKQVFACGDVVGEHLFTHAAELHASTILQNFFSPLKKKHNTAQMAWVTYTSPEIATFGESEDSLKMKRVRFKTVVYEFTHDDRAIVDENTEGTIKLFVSRRGKILGGFVVHQLAGEIVQELLLLKALKKPLSKLLKKVYPYPTATRANRSLALSELAHTLTPLRKAVLHLLFR